MLLVVGFSQALRVQLRDVLLILPQLHQPLHAGDYPGVIVGKITWLKVELVHASVLERVHRVKAAARVIGP